MILYVKACTSAADLYIDFFMLDLPDGQQLTMDWGMSEINRFEGGFEATYRDIEIDQQDASGMLPMLQDAVISEVQVFSPTQPLTRDVAFNTVVLEENGSSVCLKVRNA